MVGVPHFGPDVASGIMAVENNLQATAPRTLDNLIQQCQPAQPFQVRIQFVIDPLRCTRRIEELVRVRQANGIEACVRDLIEHVLPVANPQPMRGEGTRLKPKPVDPCQMYLAPRCIYQLTMKGAEETYWITKWALGVGSLQNRQISGFPGVQDQYRQNKYRESEHDPSLETCYAGTSHITLPFHLI